MSLAVIMQIAQERSRWARILGYTAGDLSAAWSNGSTAIYSALPRYLFSEQDT
jgi:hypothetical protein